MVVFDKTVLASNNEETEKLLAEITDVYLKEAGSKAISRDEFIKPLREMLAELQNKGEKDKDFRILVSRKKDAFKIVLSQKGPKFDSIPDDEGKAFTEQALKAHGITPVFGYSNGINYYVWDVAQKKPKPSLLIAILVALGLSILFSIVLRFLPLSTKDLIIDQICLPVFNKLISVLSAVATPLVFLAVIEGMLGIGDVNAFGHIGSTVVIRMLFSYILAMIIFSLVYLPVYGLASSAEILTGGSESAVGDIIHLVLDIVPDNLLMPFTIGNDLQVITISIFAGVVILLIRNSIPTMVEIIREGSTLINKMMALCTNFLPIIVFFGLINLFASSDMEKIKSIAVMLVLFLIGSFMMVATMIIRTCIVTRVNYKCLFKKQLPTLMINLTTSSQVAALPENMKCCKEGFGIDPKITDFALPLGIVAYMPCGAIFLAATAWSCGAAYGLSVTTSVFIKIIVVAIVLAIAAPPIPGSAMIVLPIFFTSCNIPLEAFPLAILFGTIGGYFLPAFNGFILQLEILMSSVKLGMTDMDALKRDPGTIKNTQPM